MLLHKRWWVLITLVVLLTSLSAAPGIQVDQNQRFFVETGHWVEGDFLAFYEQNPKALLLFGYPITDAYENPQAPGQIIQHFQRARFVLVPNGPPGKRVELAPIGDWLYSEVGDGEKANFAVTSGACRTFQLKGIPVCYAFLSFYDANHGAIYFGEPVSQVEILDGRLVQYFEYARMEWRPEMAPGQRVALADIGRMDFDTRIGDIQFTNPDPNIPMSSPLKITVRAFPARPLLANGDLQTIYVVVHDQRLQPVVDAQVTFKLTYPNGTQDKLAAHGPTDSDGITQIDFRLEGVNPNEVVNVTVEATLSSNLKSAAVTWFRAWW
jgi:hypothetical protein